jgi:NADH ubiquinone oxidoreductase subunit NDUFA12.
MSFVKGLLKKIKNFRMAHEDAKLNRKIVGYDRLNNRYYQYFDEEGNETKRVCEYSSKFFTEEDIDPYWNAWLKKMQRDPPTEEQLKEFYEAEDKFKQSAYEYEKKDAEMMSKYRKEQASKAKEERPETSQTKGQGVEFEPGKWNPNAKTKKF